MGEWVKKVKGYELSVIKQINPLDTMHSVKNIINNVVMTV